MPNDFTPRQLHTIARGLGHDFNNLLSAILGYAQIARRQSTGEVANRLDALIECANRAAALLRQLMTLSQNGPSRNARVEVKMLLEEAARLLSRVLDKDIVVKTSIPTDIKPVDGDTGQLLSAILLAGISAANSPGTLMLSAKNKSEAVELSIAVGAKTIPIPVPVFAASPKAVSLEGKTVLLIGDDPGIIDSLHTSFAEAGASVLLGLKALKAKRKLIDIVIVDLGRSELSNAHMLRELKSFSPVIALTGDPSPKKSKQIIFVQKPYEIDELFELVGDRKKNVGSHRR